MQVSLANAVHLYQQNQNLGVAVPGREQDRNQRMSQVDSSYSNKDSVTISSQRSSGVDSSDSAVHANRSTNTNASNPASNEGQLSAEELTEVQKLQRRDAEVRAHEQAHLSTAGQYAAGGPTYTYQTGPDGKRYAIGGEVPIDISKESTPEATIAKMRTVRRAALAPADPSPADRQIAAQASAIEAQATVEKRTEDATGEKAEAATITGTSQETPLEGQTGPENGISRNQRAMMIAAYRANAALV